MTLPASGKRTSLPPGQVTAPAGALAVDGSSRSSSVQGTSRRHRLRDDPRLQPYIQPKDGVLGFETQIQRFNDAPLGAVHAGHIHVLPSLVIVAGTADAVIEQTDDTCVLTGQTGAVNDCRLVFRHAYVRVHLDIMTQHGAADAHIGFLEHRNFEEVQTFSIAQPRNARGSTGGWLHTHLDYCAGPLCELQGIVWRGGLLQIESVTLSP